MNALQIDELNKEIPYEDGKIVWEAGKGYTSKLMKRLYECGYRASLSGCIHTLYDDNGHKVTDGYSWQGLLKNTALVMR